MEQEQMKQPTYEELMNAYMGLGREFEKLQTEYSAIKSDKILERLKVMMDIIAAKDVFDDEIIELAKWHMLHIMEKPKE